MSAKLLPPGLAAEVAVPLVQAAERISTLKPWEEMSDMFLIGLRAEGTGELHAASILGTLGEVFGVVIYRHDVGLRWIHHLVTEPFAQDHDAALEALDLLKVEWVSRRELKKTDLETLANASYKPTTKGRIWPRFESCQPGWFPWYPTVDEARLLTAHLGKVLRLVRLFQRVPNMYSTHICGEVPVVPAGDEFTLQQNDLEWLPLLPPPAPLPEAISLSAEERAAFGALPRRQNSIFEFLAPLMPEMSYLDEVARRPCIARVGLMVDRDSHFILSTALGHGAAPLAESLKRGLLQGLGAAKALPRAIHVADERVAAALGPACESIGVPVHVAAQLNSAAEALDELTGRFRRR